jgi:MFS superfamily sulfate permease-like transporter
MSDDPDLSVDLVRELCRVVERLSDDIVLLGIVGSYGDTLTDAEVLDALRECSPAAGSSRRGNDGSQCPAVPGADGGRGGRQAAGRRDRAIRTEDRRLPLPDLSAMVRRCICNRGGRSRSTAISSTSPQPWRRCPALASCSTANWSFPALQLRLHPAASRVVTLARAHPARFVAFDLLADEDGRPLLQRPFAKRRAALEAFFREVGPGAPFRLSQASRSAATARGHCGKHVRSFGAICMRLTQFAAARPGGGRSALRDAVAGATLASMNIPQVLGYTRVAGTPVVTGLYTALLPPLAFAAFGSSRHLVTAADSATAAILFGSLSHMADVGSAKYVALASAVALQTAVLLALARIFRLGFLADFLSRTVLVGFLTGVGIQVAVAMLGDMLGLTVTARATPNQVIEIARSLGGIRPSVVLLSAAVTGLILIARRRAPRWPVPFVIVMGTISASAAFGFGAHGISLIGPVPGGLPLFGLPDVSWRELLDLLPVAASCFVMILAQSAATARAFASRYGERLQENDDLLGLSAANAAAAISGTFVVNGSPTQTAMAEAAGARSQFAQVTFAGIVMLVLLFLTGPLQYLPRCVLASIVFTIALGMVDFSGLRDIGRESPGEVRLALLTAVAVAGIGVEQGILIAIGLSLLRHVNHSYRPHSAVLLPDATGRWEPSPARPGIETAAGLIVYRFGADLFFANVDRFADEVRTLVDQAPHRVRCFVLDAAAITDIDYSAGRTLRSLQGDLTRRDIRLIFARVSQFLRADLDRHGVTASLGGAQIFATLYEGLAAAERIGFEEVGHAQDAGRPEGQ